MDTKFQITEESKHPENLEKGSNFQKVDLGLFNNISKYTIENKDLNLKSEGKIFLHDLLDLTSAEISINYAPVGYKAPFKHSHNQNEEIYIVLKGKGIIEVDDKKLEIQEGSIVKISPDGIRTMENTSDEDLIFIVIQAKANSLEQFTLLDGKIV